MHLVRDPLPGPARGAPAMTQPRAVRLLVCGNADRGDDGAALAAVAGLLPGLAPHLLGVIDVRRCEMLDVEHLVDVPPAMACVIVDTAVGIPVGSVVTIPLMELPDRDGASGPTPRSSHTLPIGQVVALAAILRDRAARGHFRGARRPHLRLRALARQARPCGAPRFPEGHRGRARRRGHDHGDPRRLTRRVPRRRRAERPARFGRPAPPSRTGAIATLCP